MKSSCSSWNVAGTCIVLILFLATAIAAHPITGLNFGMMGPHMGPVSDDRMNQYESVNQDSGAPVYGMQGMGMMETYPSSALPLSDEEVHTQINEYASRYGDAVAVADVMFFSNNVYAVLVDRTTGEGIGEILLNRYTGAIGPEPGPNVAWNTQSGHFWSRVLPERYAKEEAREIADVFLEGYLPGATVMAPKSFPGYYTFDFGRSEIEGMLSVHAGSGDVWVHTWHGQYLGGHESRLTGEGEE